MAEQDPGNVQRQLGAIFAQLEGITGMMRERSAQADRQSDELKSEMRTLKHDQRGVEQKVEIVKWKQEQLESRVRLVSDSLAEIKEPVANLMQLRTRVGGMIIVITALGGLVWLACETIGRWALDHWVDAKSS